MGKSLIEVSVVYARSEAEIKVVSLELPSGSTVEQAIDRSGVLVSFPDINLAVNKVGIFSKLVSLDKVLNQNDRVEIYRPLKIDPKAARRDRAG